MLLCLQKEAEDQCAAMSTKGGGGPPGCCAGDSARLWATMVPLWLEGQQSTKNGFCVMLTTTRVALVAIGVG